VSSAQAIQAIGGDIYEQAAGRLASIDPGGGRDPGVRQIFGPSARRFGRGRRHCGTRTP
jgi:hypothetical protein